MPLLLFLIHLFPVPAPKQPDDRQFRAGEEIRVNLHHGKIEDAVIRAVIHDADGIKLQVDVGRSRPDGAD